MTQDTSYASHDKLDKISLLKNYSESTIGQWIDHIRYLFPHMTTFTYEYWHFPQRIKK